MQTYRTSMLKLNASVHSWLTRQERRLQDALQLEHQLLNESATIGGVAPRIDEAKNTATSTEQQNTMGVEQTTNQENNKQEAKNNLSSSGSIEEIVETKENAKIGVSTSTPISSPKLENLNTLITSENVFHKHLKDEVSDMYSSWDEADGR